MKNVMHVVKGKNFSGRSNFLKNLCNENNTGIYIGEIPSNYISGVSPTVKAELNLFSTNTDPNVKDAVNRLIEELGFSKLYNSNPYLLSGGEQVILTILSGILKEPQLLAIDTIIEQLSEEWKKPLFQLIQNNLMQLTYISDNRINEYGIDYKTLLPENKLNYGKEFLEPSFLNFSNNHSSCNISIKNLTFGYRKNVSVLENINLNLTPGIYFLKGTNGAGKSTLAKILAGILKVKYGIISLSGKKINPFKHPGKIFGYSFQNPDEQLFSRTVYKEIVGDKRNESRSTIIEREKFIQMFGLNLLQEYHPAELPYVMRKRVALAATIANERSWYIIDEPTIGQDDQFVGFLFKLFNHMAAIGKGIVIISHSQAFINKFSAKTLYLVNGVIKYNVTNDHNNQEELA